ncbi:MAG: electron transfer flavoprotein subunit alpha/FixB family protein, partial [Clostridia bacterium]|nr:electron transfer flavoprotein subunit alpha/FixB family protein [Clostridia bacterium]
MILVFLETVDGRPSALSRQMAGLALRLSAEKPCAMAAYGYPVDGPFFARGFARAAETVLRRLKPEAALLAATPTGKSIAPFLAAALQTGLAADCNEFSWTKEGLLLARRPAFGGALRADILTPRACPQLATVRENVFPDYAGPLDWKPLAVPGEAGERLLALGPLTHREDIGAARRILVLGGGLRRKEDIETARLAARALGASLACSRALTARGWLPQSMQIGLSGRAVRPELLLTLGVSGSAQFMAGVAGAKRIIAVDSDPNAPIFAYASLSVCADL